MTRPAPRILYHIPPVGRKSKGGIILELKIKFPSGGYVKFSLEPMERARFEYICWLAGIFIFGSGFIKFFELII